jgi:hypothetical protein
MAADMRRAQARTDMFLDALEMARLSRGGRRLVGLVTHADAGLSSHPCGSPNLFLSRGEPEGVERASALLAPSYHIVGAGK